MLQYFILLHTRHCYTHTFTSITPQLNYHILLSVFLRILGRDIWKLVKIVIPKKLYPLWLLVDSPCKFQDFQYVLYCRLIDWCIGALTGLYWTDWTVIEWTLNEGPIRAHSTHVSACRNWLCVINILAASCLPFIVFRSSIARLSALCLARVYDYTSLSASCWVVSETQVPYYNRSLVASCLGWSAGR